MDSSGRGDVCSRARFAISNEIRTVDADNDHWPAKGEPQKGNAQKVTFKSLKRNFEVT